jgi:hypothetical protein
MYGEEAISYRLSAISFVSAVSNQHSAISISARLGRYELNH